MKLGFNSGVAADGKSAAMTAEIRKTRRKILPNVLGIAPARGICYAGIAAFFFEKQGGKSSAPAKAVAFSFGKQGGKSSAPARQSHFSSKNKED